MDIGFLSIELVALDRKQKLFYSLTLFHVEKEIPELLNIYACINLFLPVEYRVMVVYRYNTVHTNI